MTTAASEPTAIGPARQTEARRGVLIVSGYALLVVVLGAAVATGLGVRRWTWDAAEPIRFQVDIRNGFRQGSRALDWGYLTVYDKLVARAGGSGRYGLDYAPLRLGVMTAWVDWLRAQEPGIKRWRNEYALTWPLLRLNLAMELAAAVGMFLLVWWWMRRRDGPGGLWAAWVGGLAAMLLWFNPALVLEAHGWPQWDVWALPFFIWALLAVSVERYLAAGALIALGAMLKGQVLMVSPVLVLIPLLRGQRLGVLRLALGFATGVALVTWPWLLRGPAVTFVVAVTVLATLGVWALTRMRVRSRGFWTLGAAVAVAATAAAVVIFDGSMAWYHVGWSGPTTNHAAMHIGPAANLAAILRQGWQWQLNEVVAPGWLGFEVTIRTVMAVGFGLTLLWCGVWASRHAAHRRKAFLLAAIAPWALMFALMPQMHERYLIWAAACSAAFVAFGAGGIVIHLLITGIAFMQMIRSMIRAGGDRELPMLRSWIDGALPGIGWALLVICGVLLWMMTARESPPAERVGVQASGAGDSAA